MKPTWNKCLFCVHDLSNTPTTPERGGFRKNISGGGDENLSAIKLAVKYLLPDCVDGGENGELVENILNIGKEGEGVIPVLCEQCQFMAASISELHLRLEVIQMKIVNLVEILRKEVILKCSEVCEDRKVGEDMTSTSIMDMIHFFHVAVSGNQVPIKVPCVLLEKCLRFRKGTPAGIPNSVEERGNSTVPKKTGEEVNPTVNINNDAELDCAIKTEPDIEVLEGSECSENYHHNLSFMESVDMGSTPKNRETEKIDLEKNRRSTRMQRKRLKRATSKIHDMKEVVPKRRRKRMGRGSRRKKKHSCDLCPSYITHKLHKFEFHLQTHETGERRFHCSTCPNDLWISGQQLYDLHVDCHNGRLKLTCDICHVKIDRFLLLEHMKVCSKGEVKLYPCANCTFVTTIRENLLEHLRHHDKTARIFCDDCGKQMGSRGKYLQHLFQAHAAIEKIPCPRKDCGRSFLDKYQLYGHELQHQNKFRCSICDKSFASLANVKKHEQMTHAGERRFSCDQCGDQFFDRRSLERHHVNVHGAPKLQCQFCPKSFSDQYSLAIHQRIHTGDTFGCDQCGLQFTILSSLTTHMKSHADSTQLSFVCDMCGKAYRTDYHLNRHKKIHAVKKFKCETCDAAFVLSKYLADHRRTHTGERPFICKTCGKGFTQKGSLNIHTKKCSTQNILK